MQDCRKSLVVMLFASAALLAGVPCAAEINLYLHSTVEAEKEITLGDIASIDGAAGESLGRLVIPSQVYADGYCDRKELESLLSGVFKETTAEKASVITRAASKKDDIIGLFDFPHHFFIEQKGFAVVIIVHKKFDTAIGFLDFFEHIMGITI